MHFYQIPDVSTLSDPEVSKLRDLVDEFNNVAMRTFQRDPNKTMKLLAAMTDDERATVQGMMQLVHSRDGRANALETMLTLQVCDITVDVMQRVDSSTVRKAVPAEMATAEAADLFKKYDLPALEKLARSKIKRISP